MQQFDFRRGGKKCSVSDRPLEPGEVYWSALIELPDGQTSRLDFSDEHWDGPNEDCIGFWKQQVPNLDTGKVYWAPRSVLLSYFKHQLDNQQTETAFVMSLLLLQKRYLTQKDTIESDDGTFSILVDRQSSETFEVPDIMISDESVQKIQSELAEHLFSNQPILEESESE
ncbi:MAG: hypothetical protein AAGA30_15560 [Planctomycetota bacterium]